MRLPSCLPVLHHPKLTRNSAAEGGGNYVRPLAPPIQRFFFVEDVEEKLCCRCATLMLLCAANDHVDLVSQPFSLYHDLARLYMLTSCACPPRKHFLLVDVWWEDHHLSTGVYMSLWTHRQGKCLHGEWRRAAPGHQTGASKSTALLRQRSRRFRLVGSACVANILRSSQYCQVTLP